MQTLSKIRPVAQQIYYLIICLCNIQKTALNHNRTCHTTAYRCLTCEGRSEVVIRIFGTVSRLKYDAISSTDSSISTCKIYKINSCQCHNIEKDRYQQKNRTSWTCWHEISVNARLISINHTLC